MLPSSYIALRDYLAFHLSRHGDNNYDQLKKRSLELGLISDSIVQAETVKSIVQEEIIKSIVQAETVKSIIQEETVKSIVQEVSIKIMSLLQLSCSQTAHKLTANDSGISPLARPMPTIANQADKFDTNNNPRITYFAAKTQNIIAQNDVSSTRIGQKDPQILQSPLMQAATLICCLFTYGLNDVQNIKSTNLVKLSKNGRLIPKKRKKKTIRFTQQHLSQAELKKKLYLRQQTQQLLAPPKAYAASIAMHMQKCNWMRKDQIRIQSAKYCQGSYGGQDHLLSKGMPMRLQKSYPSINFIQLRNIQFTYQCYCQQDNSSLNLYNSSLVNSNINNSNLPNPNLYNTSLSNSKQPITSRCSSCFKSYHPQCEGNKKICAACSNVCLKELIVQFSKKQQKLRKKLRKHKKVQDTSIAITPQQTQQDNQPKCYQYKFKSIVTSFMAPTIINKSHTLYNVYYIIFSIPRYYDLYSQVKRPVYEIVITSVNNQSPLNQQLSNNTAVRCNSTILRQNNKTLNQDNYIYNPPKHLTPHLMLNLQKLPLSICQPYLTSRIPFYLLRQRNNILVIMVDKESPILVLRVGVKGKQIKGKQVRIRNKRGKKQVIDLDDHQDHQEYNQNINAQIVDISN